MREVLLEVLLWAVIGLLGGWLAGKFIEGARYGVIGNLIVGLVGAFMGALLAQFLFVADPFSGFTLSTLITALVGAVLFVVILNLLAGRHI